MENKKPSEILENMKQTYFAGMPDSEADAMIRKLVHTLLSR